MRDYITSSSDIPLLKTKLEDLVDQFKCLQWNEEHTAVEINIPAATGLFKKGIHSIKRSWFVIGSDQETDFLAFNAAINDNLFSIVISGPRDVNLETGEYGPNDILTLALAGPTMRGKIYAARPQADYQAEMGYCNYA